MLPDRPMPNPSADARLLAKRRFVTSAAIGFAFTFVVTVGAIALGLVPQARFGADLGVILLFAPLVALVLAVIVEVIRAAASPDGLQPSPDSAFTGWKPGHGEG